MPRALPLPPLSSRHSRPVLALTVAVALAFGFSPVLAATTTVNQRVEQAVVSLSGSVDARGVAAAGVQVIRVLPQVGIEVVRGTPAALLRLAGDPSVTGISRDQRLHPTGRDVGSAGNGVLAWQALGGQAGRDDAGAGVTVALVDTGVSDTPALNRASGRLVDGVDTSQLFDGGQARTSGIFTDGYGHGTFMASLIAGGPVAGSDGRGVGVAPDARVVVVKVADDQGTTSLSEVLAGLDWVAAQAPKIQVVNIALGQDRPTPLYGADPLTAAIAHLTEHGLVVVAAAGNTPGEVTDPGLAPQALTVGAADTTGPGVSVAPFSGSGNVDGVAKPDLVAPGMKLLGLLPADSQIARQHPGSQQPSGLWRGSGTSEATAVASGAAAIFLSTHPDARIADVKPALRAAARPMQGASAAGQGLLRLATAVRGDDGTAGLDQNAWNQNAWLGGAWADWLASSWSASSWSASSWSASSWSASSWSASSWSASSWSASSWSASSWSASSWSASSWSASSWSASSWSASSWSASSWSAHDWGDSG